MDKVYVGKIVSTHGIKGEMKIKSNFPFKNKVFMVGNNLIIDNNNYVIKSYRMHKGFDMVTLNDYKDINEILFLLKKDVYYDKDNLVLDEDEVLDEDLLKYRVFDNEGKEGKIKEIFYASINNKVLRVEFDKEILVPFNSPMMKISKENHEIIINMIDGM